MFSKNPYVDERSPSTWKFFFNFDEYTFAIWTFSTWRTDCSSACVTRGSKAVGKPRPLIMAPITAHTGTPCKTL